MDGELLLNRDVSPQQYLSYVNLILLYSYWLSHVPGWGGSEGQARFEINLILVAHADTVSMFCVLCRKGVLLFWYCSLRCLVLVEAVRKNF